jgi:hypothetical protein
VSILGPLPFHFYINDLPAIFGNSVKTVLFADDTSLVISSYNNIQYSSDVNTSVALLDDWLNSNLLTLNFDKTKHVQFVTKSTFNSGTSVRYHNNMILNSTNVNILGTVMESSYIPAHAQTVQSLLFAEVIKPFMPTETLKMVYYSYFHSFDLWNYFGGQFFL